MHDRPSMFAFATSELSQDAFLGWLLAWADPRFAQADGGLHRAGRRFLHQLAEVVGWPKPTDQGSVRVELQVDRIDLLVRVGSDRALVIEDKVDANEAGNPLVAYKERAARRLAVPTAHVAGVYLKTGDQSDFSKAKAAGFVLFDRTRLLDVLQAAVDDGVRNDILLDFLDHMRRREAQTSAWRTHPVDRWVGDAHNLLWRGFFGALQSEIGEGNWGFVNNAGGGVYAFWWARRQVEGGWLYLQADSRVRLAVRVWVADGHDRTDVRRRWQGALTSTPDATVRFVAPPNPRSGKSAEVARFATPWVLGDVTGKLDLAATVASLRAVAAGLDAMAVPQAEGRDWPRSQRRRPPRLRFGAGGKQWPRAREPAVSTGSGISATNS
ncbi:MAG TPA: PD-(D/E)XK nuclease family protein [Myxococcota bacterium]|nr:PD-(D/E)XK nuclease family protein [Myxococcota bacterium]